MIFEAFRAMRRLTAVRKELREAVAEHSEAARELIAASDEISKGKKIGDRERERQMDALVRRFRAHGAAE